MKGQTEYLKNAHFGKCTRSSWYSMHTDIHTWYYAYLVFYAIEFGSMLF